MNKSIRYALLILTSSCQVYQTFSMDRLPEWLRGTAGDDRKKVLAVEKQYRAIFSHGRSDETIMLLCQYAIASGEATCPLIKAQQDLVQTIAELKKIKSRQMSSSDKIFSEDLPSLIELLIEIGGWIGVQDEFVRERMVADEHAERARTASALERLADALATLTNRFDGFNSTVMFRLSELEDRVGSLSRRADEYGANHTELVECHAQTGIKRETAKRRIMTRTGCTHDDLDHP